MSRYNRGKIYKIIDNITGKVYFGSTIEPTLAKRLTKHIASFKLYKQGKGYYVTSYELFENGNYSIILVELYSCESKDELLMRERFYIENNECVNKVKKVVLTIEEKEHYQQQYQQEHKKEISQHNQQYYQEHKEKISQHHQQYRQEHKEEALQYQLEYYQNNKEEINKKQSQKITCECGREIRKGDMATHKKRKIHNDLISQQI